jgi:hypothetical protein
MAGVCGPLAETKVLKWRNKADVFRNHRPLCEANQGGCYHFGEDAGDYRRLAESGNNQSTLGAL